MKSFFLVKNTEEKGWAIKTLRLVLFDSFQTNLDSVYRCFFLKLDTFRCYFNKVFALPAI
jgi:hypothetical protein